MVGLRVYKSLKKIIAFFCVGLILLVVSCEQENKHNDVVNTNEILKEEQNSKVVSVKLNDSLNEIQQKKALNYPLLILPVDESDKNVELKNTIDSLQKIIQVKDTLALFALMDTNIVSSYGGAIIGFDGIKNTWKGRNIWDKLNEIINLGGVFVKGDKEFMFPYCGAGKFYGDWDLEWNFLGVITKSNTLLFKNQDLSSDILDTLNFSIVQIVDNDVDLLSKKKIKIKLVGTETEGFIKIGNFYRTNDYKLVFEDKGNDDWVITSFAPYD